MTMHNNPNNLSAEDYIASYVRNEDEPYRVFIVEEMRRTGLYHVVYRIYWDRDGEPVLNEDCAVHFSESIWERG